MKNIVRRLRKWILNTLKPITVWVGQMHLPFTRKKVTGQDYLALRPKLKPGMVFVTYTHGELSNLLIPGHWSHVGMYVGDEMVIEALGKGVTKTDVISFLLAKDRVALMSPSFAEESKMEKAVKWAMDQEGKGYDFHFSSGNDAFYCSELVYGAYQHAFGGESPFTTRETWGELTIVPDDIYLAKGKWECIWSNHNVSTSQLDGQ